MGEAKRRKLLDPQYAKGSRVKTSPDRFKVEFKSKVIDSYVTVHIVDCQQEKEATLIFHLYLVGTKMYAEAIVEKTEIHEHEWVGKHINELSPMICKLALMLRSNEKMGMGMSGLSSQSGNLKTSA
jgi:hypothetical protein